MLTRVNAVFGFIVAAFVGWHGLGVAAAQGTDPLPSWNDGPTKQSIIEFVTKVTSEGGPDFVKPEERIATFDNDGTLWIEQPLYNQFVFAVDEVKAGQRASGVERQGALQVGARGRHESRRRHGREGHAGDRRGHA